MGSKTEKAAIAVWGVALTACIVGMFTLDPSKFAAPESVVSKASAATEAPANWHVRSTRGGCIASTPAAYLELFKGSETKPTVNETRDDNDTLVKVAITSWGMLAGETVTFYRTEADCLAAIEESERIPDDYR